MGVLMRVQMRDGNTRRLQFSNLRRHFGFNLIGIDAATDRAQSKAVQALVEASVRKFLVAERCSLLPASYRHSVDESRMAADAEAWLRFCALDGVIKRLTIRHQRR